MIVLYAQLYKNRMVVRNLTTQQQVSGSVTFSNQRILIADFFPAVKLLRDLIQQVAPWSFWHRLGMGRLEILAHALEMNEGGLSPVEERAILEMTFVASRRRCHYPKIIASKTLLNDQQVLMALNKTKTPPSSSDNRPKIIS